MPSDLAQLIDMGFDAERAQLAVSKTGGLQGALEWLEANQEKSLDEIKASTSATTQLGIDPDEPPVLKPGEEARSLVCNQCGKRFRSQAQAEFHASKTEHVDFSESTEEIAPLTEEEKKARLEELRQKLAAKKAQMLEQDKSDQKRNEEIRKKSTKETQDLKEELQKKEQLKEVAKKRREKQEEVEARARIRARIEADKEERRVRAEREKAERQGRAPPPAAVPATSLAPTTPATSKPASAYTESRLRLQTPTGNVMKTFPVDTTLFEVAAAVTQEIGMEVESFTQNFPRKVFDAESFGETLKQLGLIPSASLIVK
ncbi:UBX domain-containing protein [Blastomyces gilchristii SLH14081]|uniref:UBX domain-containing protein n=1 Tax=Blastomyces gilchristii (strain SLH14081) TaxID=559298 RepID=A0A179UW39_BLAGS|nr:UBX domain-containing protein [Blastomyces gilchristii SLH14081]OAT11307.1 UBX domain-containing protein [Blastomyces gilchristii SLH14081]